MELQTVSNLIFPLLNTKATNKGTTTHVLRLDKLHPIVSGNKWYKLKYILADAINNKCTTIITFGGVWSNHIIATAAACKYYNLQSIAMVRSDEELTTATLLQAKAYGMHIQYVTRSQYKLLKYINGINPLNANEYYIPEGGSNALGIQGTTEILSTITHHKYTHILCCVGTGTTMVGLVNGSTTYQTIVGINAIKTSLTTNQALLQYGTQHNYELLNGYSFGGFAKYNTELLQFMNSWYALTNIPTDIVYTSKLFYAYTKLLEQDYFGTNSNILIVHSGGLQGNQSLPLGVLHF